MSPPTITQYLGLGNIPLGLNSGIAYVTALHWKDSRGLRQWLVTTLLRAVGARR